MPEGQQRSRTDELPIDPRDRIQMNFRAMAAQCHGRDCLAFKDREVDDAMSQLGWNYNPVVGAAQPPGRSSIARQVNTERFVDIDPGLPQIAKLEFVRGLSPQYYFPPLKLRTARQSNRFVEALGCVECPALQFNRDFLGVRSGRTFEAAW